MPFFTDSLTIILRNILNAESESGCANTFAINNFRERFTLYG